MSKMHTGVFQALKPWNSSAWDSLISRVSVQSPACVICFTMWGWDQRKQLARRKSDASSLE